MKFEKTINLRLILVAHMICIAGARIRSPLIDEELPKVKNKAAECVFGKEILELGSKWIPDLGVPIGVLYCMKCECVPFHRKRRIIAKVQCRNIKNECPEPTCDEPELLPGRCCKTCPGDIQNQELVQTIVAQNVLDDEEKNSKHYASLLSQRSSLVFNNNDDARLPTQTKNSSRYVATGRFTFHKRNLYFSFYVSERTERPQSVQFVNNEGTILEEFQLSDSRGHINSAYQNTTKKICGVWHRLPRDYRRLLKEERMYAVLVWGAKDQPEYQISGQMLKYVALSTELFSSLLEPPTTATDTAAAAAAGTAVISVATSVSPSLHLAVIFNGIFLPTETFEAPILITLYSDEKKHFILQEKLRVQKPASELNFLEISSPISISDLRLLSRGRVMITVSSVSRPDTLTLTGSIMTRLVCEMFQTALSSSYVEKSSNRQGLSGMAWMYLNNDGSLIYNVLVDNIPEEEKAVSITLIDVGGKRKMELEELMTPTFSGGWANGTINKIGPKVLDALYSGNLAVNVATASESSVVGGKLAPKFVADARDANSPVLLRRENYTLPTSAVGLAWVLIDADCHLHYDVYVTGLGSGIADRGLQLYVEMLPMIAPGAPVISRLLDEFRGNQVEGSPTETLTKEELSRFDTGVVFIKVKDKESRETLLAATLKIVNVPSVCLPSQVTDNDVPISYDTEVSHSGVCLHEGKFYQEDAQWASTSDPCTMCFCQNGNNKCDTMTCPDLTCPENTDKTKFPGECCPVCSDFTEMTHAIPQGCTFGGRFYSSGSKFHPFLVPGGFDLCTECTCDPVLLEMTCTRLAHCGSYAETSVAKASDNFTYVSDPVHSLGNTMVKEKKDEKRKSADEILANGGCKNIHKPDSPYENGSEFHPFINSLGEYKCITCKCRNSKQEDCTRVKCNLEVCDKIFDLRTMTARNTADFCCSRKQCKQFRIRRKKQKQRSNVSR